MLCDDTGMIPMPTLGMRVRLKGDPKQRLPAGVVGEIDVISKEDPNLFWVCVAGGFYGWTSFETWEPILEGAD